MHLSDILTAELAALRTRAGKDKLAIVETGSIRGEGDQYHVNDGWSTLTFAREVKQHGGSFISIDLDTSTADKVLRAEKLRSQVKLVECPSIEGLTRLARNLNTFDVAFLDTLNDSTLTFHEYLIARQLMNTPGLIMIDDVDKKSKEFLKGHEILPWAEENNIPFRLIERTGENGFHTGVMVFEV